VAGRSNAAPVYVVTLSPRWFALATSSVPTSSPFS